MVYHFMGYLVYYCQSYLEWSKSYAEETQRATPKGVSAISFQGFPGKPLWWRHYIATLGELTYSLFSGQPFDHAHKYRFSNWDFPDGTQVKATTQKNLLIPKKEFLKTDPPISYVLALVSLFEDIEGQYGYAKVELAGMITRDKAEEVIKTSTLNNVGNKSYLIERKYLNDLVYKRRII